ncbi:MAG: Dickkopf N-terminal cysteine-rich domain-containing protein [Kofleriaceae bacterium]
MYQCCSEGEIESILGVGEPRTEEECVSDLSRRCERELATLSWSIDNGRASFDASAMNACLEAFVAPSQACADIYTEVPWEGACENLVWVGEQAVGEECFFNYECAGSDGDTFCGPSRTCVARPTEGMSCLEEDCARNLFCDTNTGTCTPRRDTGGMCYSNNECIEDRFCDPTTMMCAPLKAVNEACTNDSMCATAECQLGTCTALGQSCFTADSCTYGYCAGSTSLCTSDAGCGSGTCSVGGGVCTTPGFCDTGSGAGECMFAIKCEKECVGDIKCVEQHQLIDFCEAVEYIPGVEGQDVLK